MSNSTPDLDLTSLLSADQRAELTLLIATATETMRDSLIQGFRHDSPAPTPPPRPKKSSPPPDQNDPLSQVPGIQLVDNTQEGEKDADTGEEEKEGRMEEKGGRGEERDGAANERDASRPPRSPQPQKQDEPQQKQEEKQPLPSPALVKLEAAAVNSFDRWREQVLCRIGEVVNAPSTARSQSSSAAPSTESSAPSAATEEDAKDDDLLSKHYPPIPTPLTSTLSPSQSATVLQSLLLLLLSLKAYDARSRILLLHLASSLHVPLSTLTSQEAHTATTLLQAAQTSMTAEKESASRIASSKVAKRWKVGLASVAGAALIGVTGGLAAPFVAAGIGTVMGGLGLGATAAAGYLGAVASSGALVGAMFGAYGGKMTGNMMSRYAAEVSDFSFLPIRRDSETRRLRVAVGVTGWLVSSESEITEPWLGLGPSLESYALRWEVAALLDLGHSLQTILTSTALSYLKSEVLRRTVFATLYMALWPVALLKAARVLDNPFSIAKTRSEKAGLVLADALINRAQGERPVTLVGFSLGARVIYACLLSLAERGAFGLVENVVLMGAAVPADPQQWRRMRAVVAGRLVNVYSEEDFILAFLYRTSAIQVGVAGLQEVQGVKGVQNVDVSERVKGHLKYRFAVGAILAHVLEGDTEREEVGREEAALRELERREEREVECAVGRGDKGEVGMEVAAEKVGRDLEARRREREREEAERKERLDRRERGGGNEGEEGRVEVRR